MASGNELASDGSAVAASRGVVVHLYGVCGGYAGLARPLGLDDATGYRNGHQPDFFRFWHVAGPSSMACVALPASHEAAAGLPGAGKPDPRQSP